MQKPLLVLIDGHALVHRAFHALPPLSVSKTGEPTGAVYGFVLMLIKALQDLRPTHWAIAFDRPTPTFRHLEYEEYKAQRPRAPDELVKQFRRVREVVDGFNMSVFEMDGYEADDILGTIARIASLQGIDTIIVTGDNDELALVSDKVRVLLPKRTFGEIALHDLESVREKYGIQPEQIPDLKALKGDPSDNIPGIAGVGDKTATRLVQQFGSVEGIYDRINEVTPVKLRDLLVSEETKARTGKRLATIVTDVPIDFDLVKCTVGGYDRNRLVRLFSELEFYRMLDRLPGNGSEGVAEASLPEDVKYEVVGEQKALEEVIEELSSSDSVMVGLVCHEKGRGDASIAGAAICASPDKAYYIPLADQPGVLGKEANPALADLGRLMANERLAKVAHNSKLLLRRLTEQGVVVNNLDFDTMVAAYLLGEKSLSVQALSLNKLGIELSAGANEKSARSKGNDHRDLELVARTACTEVAMVSRLCDTLKAELEHEEIIGLFREVEMPLVPVLACMERNGVKLDVGLFRNMSQSLGTKLLELEQEIYSYAGRRFNINSPQQLGAVLFGELKLPGARRTKSGYSTEAAVLEDLKNSFPIVRAILEYRQVGKLKSTYIDALPALVDPRTARLHSSFNQTVTATGRLSSSEPNLQNIPIRGELGRQVRQAFVAEEDCYLVSGDYSQIDLRVLAHLSEDERLLRAFGEDKDIHTETAVEVFGASAEAVSSELRRLAKVVNFGIIYGMSDYGLEQATDLTREQATLFIDTYFQRHPGVLAYIESTKKTARERGWVETLLGRRRYIAEINSSNRQSREAAERMAINMPVQGTAADIIKIAMVRLQHMIDERQLASKMILQIHDELLLEVPPAELDMVKALIKDIMCSAMELKVPLKVDVKVGRNWGEMEIAA